MLAAQSHSTQAPAQAGSQTEWITAVVRSVNPLAEDILGFELVDINAEPLPPFTAGAHIDIRLANGLIRQYSLCNDPGETHRYVIAVLRDAGVTSLDEGDGEGAVAFLIDGKASAERRFQALEQAQALRAEGRDVAVLPMRKNMKRQIATLEEEGFTQFEKIYKD